MKTYPIGTTYTPIGYKRKDLCTVTDIYRTYNNAGELVGLRYVSTHDFMGQQITNCEVAYTTIWRGNPSNEPTDETGANKISELEKMIESLCFAAQARVSADTQTINALITNRGNQ